MKKHKYGVTMENESENPRNAIKMPGRSAVEKAGHEIKENPPAIIKHTEKKFGKKRARSQAIAVMLSKARKGK